MKLNDILNLHVFNQSLVRTGSIGLENDIDSVMILEAADIELWGKKNQLILTSYFALHEMSHEELENFFNKLHTLKISGIILKVNRLVDSAPQILLDLCFKFNIPLIEVPRYINYESIIVAIYEPILNYQSYLLRTYYDTNRIFSSINVQSMSYQHIMLQTHKLLGKSCRLSIPEYDIDMSVGDRYIDTQHTSKVTDYSTIYTKNNYSLLEVDEESSILHIHNNDSDFIHYSLDILHYRCQVKEADIMILENVMDVIQHEIYKEYYIKKERYIMLNNIAASIFFNTASSDEELSGLLEETNLDQFPYYQAVGITKRTDSHPMKIRLLRKSLQSIDPANIYYENQKYIVIIFNLKKLSDKITKETIYNLLPSNISHRIFISNLKELEQIGDIFKECIAMYNFNKKYFLSNIININDLGIFRYLGEITHTNEKEFIPIPLLNLHREHIELFETFYSFISNNQNYKHTADEMFLHPKTIRYRINRVQEIMDFDIQNSIELLNYTVGAYLIKLREG